MADTLSESQIQEFKKLFDKYDRDKGGKITTSELGAMLTSLGHEMTLEEVEEIINQFDKDGNNTMDFEEFQNMMLKKVEDAKFSKEIITDFKKYDLNGDGFISPNELREVIRVRGERLSNAEVDAMMQTVDLNQDGKVNYEARQATDQINRLFIKQGPVKFQGRIGLQQPKLVVRGD